jgi:hypothetical protein
MKHLLRLTLICISLFAVSVSVNAQSCTPNTDTVPGITPDTLQPAFVGVPYQQVIYFRLPHDTTVTIGPFTVPLIIDSLLIDSVIGLPSTFSYACNTSNCVVYGGSNGCAVISGTADTADMGTHPLQVYIRTFISDTSGASAGFVPDTVMGYFLKVELATGIPAFVFVNDFSLGKIFPNPAIDEVSVPYYLPLTGEVLISVLNLEGITCYEKSCSAKHGYNIGELNASLFPEGFYIVRVQYEGRSLFSKMQVMKKR